MSSERAGRAACPFYRQEHLSTGKTLQEHVNLCPLWHQDGAEDLRTEVGALLAELRREYGDRTWFLDHAVPLMIKRGVMPAYVLAAKRPETALVRYLKMYAPGRTQRMGRYGYRTAYRLT